MYSNDEPLASGVGGALLYNSVSRCRPGSKEPLARGVGGASCDCCSVMASCKYNDKEIVVRIINYTSYTCPMHWWILTPIACVCCNCSILVGEQQTVGIALCLSFIKVFLGVSQNWSRVKWREHMNPLAPVVPSSHIFSHWANLSFSLGNLHV